MNYLQKELDKLINPEDKIYNFIQDTSLDGLWYRDLENPENEWTNPKFWLTLGYDPEEMIDKKIEWKSIIHPDDFELVITHFIKHCKKANHVYDQVVRYIHKNGSIVYIRCRGWAIPNKEGKIIGALATHINITKEKENEEKLRDSLSSMGISIDNVDKQTERTLWESKAYHTFSDATEDGHCIIEMIFDENNKAIDYRFLLVNESFEKQTGMSNAVGKRMREFAPNHEEHWFQIYGNIALTGKSAKFENRAEQLGRWYDVYAFRFGEPENKQVGILFKDITEHKKTEQTILSLNKMIDHNLEEIKFINKELESFSYSISHYLRAPLRAVQGYANVLEEDFSKYLDEEGKKTIASINRNSQKMGTLIEDLLTFSRLGRKEMIIDHVDIESIVKETISDIREQNPADKTIFNLGSLLPVLGDKTLLKRVWQNLISNAHKYSRNSPSPTIQIGSFKDDHEIMYYIKDNGMGFNMDHYDKLFGVFERLHVGEEFEGTGVGLAIVQRIVIRHGGKIWADAKINEGASFYFTIPLLKTQ